MNFFINKNATLPLLKMELIQDGRYDFRKLHDGLMNIYEKIQNADIYFSMTDIDTGYKKICRQPAGCALKPNTCDEEEEYYITYQFSQRDTSKPGSYRGQFEIEFLDGSGTLIIPIREELNIHVLDGSIKV